MTYNEQTLLTHLERIYCKGEIPDAVLGPNLGTTAMPDSRELAVQAPSLPGEAVHENDIGVTDVGLLIDAVKRPEGDEISLSVRNDARLVVAHGEDHSYEIVLAEAQYLGTSVSADFAEMLEQEFEEQPGFPITDEEGNQLETALGVIGPDVVRFSFSPSGTEVLVGSETGHSSTVTLSDVQTSSSYELLIDAGHLSTILGLFDHYSKLRLVPTGPGEALGITYGDAYYYILNPRSE